MDLSHQNIKNLFSCKICEKKGLVVKILGRTNRTHSKLVRDFSKKLLTGIFGCPKYSGRNFALLEFREMRDLEPKISRNLRNSQGIEIPMILLLYENTSSYFLSPKNAKLLLL